MEKIGEVVYWRRGEERGFNKGFELCILQECRIEGRLEGRRVYLGG